MSAASVASPTRAVVARSSSRALLALGLREGKRMVFSPALLVIVVFVMLSGGIETFTEGGAFGLPGRSAAYDVMMFFTSLYLGLVFYISGHLVTSSARRTHADRQIEASAMSERTRGAGLCLGALLGPGSVAVMVVLLLAVLGNDVTLSEGDAALPLVNLTQIGVTFIGAALFGVLWATWLRFPGSLPIGLVVLVVGTAWIASEDRSPVNTWPWFAPYITATDFFDSFWTTQGSHTWHVLYLLSLCALAACGVMLRQREGRGRWIAVSAVAVLLSAFCGWAQLS
jgi:hypothetical protein